MTTNNPTWKQIRHFSRLCKQLDLLDRPGVADCLDAQPEEAHTKQAEAEIASWNKQPVNAAAMVPSIARWFAVGDAFLSIGVGSEADTGIKQAIDYWSRVKNRHDLSKAQRANRFAEKAGLPEQPVVFSAGPEGESGAPTQLVSSSSDSLSAPADDMERVAKALKAAGFSAAEVAMALLRR